MRETRLVFRSGGHTLVGTLLTPSRPGPFPAALLVPGSGPVDRDSNHRRALLDVTRQLATALDAAGIATFRYDKRGVGESSGAWRAAGLHDNIADARAALAALAAAPGIDRTTLVVVGHSEGALIAGALAAGPDGGPVADGDTGGGLDDRRVRGSDEGSGAADGIVTPGLRGVVLLSAAATPGEEVLRWQTRQIAPTLPAAVRGLLRLLRTDLEAKVAKNHTRIKATTTDVARVDGARINARWHREFMAYDPRRDLARIAVPVLAVTGAKDLQVDPADLETIARTVRGPVETHALPDVSHILRTQDGPASLSSYRKDVRRPVDPRVVELVVRWVQEHAASVREPDRG